MTNLQTLSSEHPIFKKTLWDKIKVKLRLIPVPEALPMRMIGESDNYCWEDWHRDMKKKYPIRYFLQETLVPYMEWNVYGRFKDAWRWARNRTFRRYHVINISNEENDWVSGWQDTDTQILFACFKLLSNFVEKEMYYVEWDATEETSLAAEEIMSLYDWWKIERPEALKVLRKNYSIIEVNKLRELETENLIKLMKIRHFLWT